MKDLIKNMIQVKIMRKDFEDLKKICEKIDSIELFQGAGGNISFKHEEKLIIKASGKRMPSMPYEGYVILNNDNLKKIFYENNLVTEEEARKYIKNQIIFKPKENLNPSMETGFHCFLPKWVVHTHPLYLNIILSTKEAKHLINKIFNKKHNFIEYKKPGYILSKSIFENYQKNEDNLVVYLLLNHGLIVAGDNPYECLKETLEISEKCKNFVNSKISNKIISYQNPTKCESNKMSGFLGNKFNNIQEFFFPDDAVFLSDIKNNPKFKIVDGKIFYNLEYESAKNIDEILYAHNIIYDSIEYIGTPNYLNTNDIFELISLEEEKQRRKLIN